MTIGFLWHCVYPWDVRLEKMINAVTAGGDSVSVICKGHKKLPLREQMDRFAIRRLLPYSPPFLGAIQKVLGYPLFFNPFWIAGTAKAIREEGINLLIVRDIPLALMASFVCKALNIPMLLDMAENYPAALMAYQNPLYAPFLFGNAWLPKKYERLSIDAADHVLVVADEQRQRLVQLGIPSSKLTLVGNTPITSFVRSADIAPPYGGVGGINPNLLYIGFLDPHRGADTVVQGVPDLLKDIPGLSVTFVGDGKARSKLLHLAERLGVSRAIDCPGWIRFDRLPEYIRRSAICLIPHLESEHTNTTLPNKLFDYMAFGKPIVATDCRPLKRVIEETDCGLTYKSGDVAGFTNAIKQLLNDPTRAVKGHNGRLAVEHRYNWEYDKRTFLTTVQSFCR